VANVNNLFGFRPINRDSGGPFFTRQYGKAVGDSTAIFMNDLVMKAATSVPDPTGQGNPAPGVTSAQNATPGTSLYLGSNISFGAASTATMQYITDAIDTIYIAQMQTGLVTTTAADAGKNANLLSGTGNATTKQSTMGIAEASVATTAGLDMRLIRVSNISPNAEGSYAIFEVMILKHELGQGTAGV
jgi:hypothetical protein